MLAEEVLAEAPKHLPEVTFLIMRAQGTELTFSESDSTNNTWTSHLSFRKRHHDLNDHHEKKHSRDEEEMTEWLARGNVIYKSIGLGLMDLVVGNEFVRLARDMGCGTLVADF